MVTAYIVDIEITKLGKEWSGCFTKQYRMH